MRGGGIKGEGVVVGGWRGGGPAAVWRRAAGQHRGRRALRSSPWRRVCALHLSRRPFAQGLPSPTRTAAPRHPPVTLGPASSIQSIQESNFTTSGVKAAAVAMSTVRWRRLRLNAPISSFAIRLGGPALSTTAVRRRARRPGGRRRRRAARRRGGAARGGRGGSAAALRSPRPGALAPRGGRSRSPRWRGSPESTPRRLRGGWLAAPSRAGQGGASPAGGRLGDDVRGAAAAQPRRGADGRPGGGLPVDRTARLMAHKFWWRAVLSAQGAPHMRTARAPRRPSPHCRRRTRTIRAPGTPLTPPRGALQATRPSACRTPCAAAQEAPRTPRRCCASPVPPR